MDYTFDEFCIAGKYGSGDNELGDGYEHAGFQSHQLAEPSHIFTGQQPRFLSSGESLNMKSKRPPCGRQAPIRAAVCDLSEL